ncbi:MAG: hypothetical protein J1F66_01225 [Clostridiales bacterium]|nr:hypothetical protein [Clostridiales bacterium]
MDFTTFISSLVRFISNSDGAYFVMYAVATCLLTQFVKKLFVSKVKVDILHKFDFAVVLPFIFALGFATLDAFLVKKSTFAFSAVLYVLVNCVSIGAMASVIFKFVSSLSGQSLASLMKNDVFGVFYTQLLYFGNARQQMLDKTLTLKDFIAEVKLISANAVDIYKSEDNVDAKRARLAKLLSGIVDEKSIETCINALNQALNAYVSTK